MAGKAEDPGHDQYSVLDMIDRLVTTKSVARAGAQQSSKSESAVDEPTLEWQSNAQANEAQTKATNSTHVNHDSIDDRQPPKRLPPDLCQLNRRIEKIDSANRKAIANMHEHVNKLFDDQDLPQPRFDGPCRHPGQL